eukprot:4998901-Prymnesium_polylepis.1
MCARDRRALSVARTLRASGNSHAHHTRVAPARSRGKPARCRAAAPLPCCQTARRTSGRRI